MTRLEKGIWIAASLIGGIIFVIVQPMYPVFFTVGTIATLGGIVTIACNIVGVVYQIGNRAPKHEVVTTLTNLCAWAVLVFACTVLIAVGVYGPDHPSIAALQ